MHWFPLNARESNACGRHFQYARGESPARFQSKLRSIFTYGPAHLTHAVSLFGLNHTMTCEIRSSKHGVGVFSPKAIRKGEEIFLWKKGDWKLRNPKNFEDLKWCNKWCIYAWDKLWGPASKNSMSMAWYVNHSKNPNMKSHFSKKGNWRFWATRNIKPDEELTVDYRELDYMD
jgi:hypothetical protein